MISIEIPFEPVPWAAPRLGKFTCYDPRERDKRAIRYLAKEQYPGPVLECPVSIHFSFGFTPPKSASKKTRALMLSREIIPTRCDCTNLQKLFEDCLKGIVIKDDRIVEYILTEKMYAEKPFMRAWIFTRDMFQDPVKALEIIKKCA